MKALSLALGLLSTTLLLAGAQDPAAVDSPHGKFGEDCALCHATGAWKPVELSPEFDHARYGLRLTGRHEGLQCGFCHVSLDFTELKGGCASCHVDAHAGELGEDCEQCHSFESFATLSDQMRMHRGSSFPLTGAHMTVACDHCHPASMAGATNYRLTDSSCIACHRADYESVSTPDHLSAGFDTSCERCHRITAWSDAHFDHSLVRGTPCADCHQDDYDATNDPDHTALAFSILCQDCHNTIDWHDANFDHTSVATTPCVNCHQDEYDGTNDPDHAGAGFPTTCQDCHNTRDWGDATLDHASFFPLTTGKHREEWSACSDCHTNSSDFSVFSCLGCHPHSNRADTDDKHSSEPEYQYDSIRCYECHPRGES